MNLVVHCKKSKFDVYVGRWNSQVPIDSKWKNPFVIGKDGTREDVIEKYRAYLQTRPDLLAAMPELRNKVLACWCAPLPCHADILVELANKEARS
jgi:hypothetical protein